jgi:hypothetical protein
MLDWRLEHIRLLPEQSQSLEFLVRLQRQSLQSLIPLDNLRQANPT